MAYTEDNGEVFKEHTPTDIPTTETTPVVEQNVTRQKVHDRYTIAYDFLCARIDVPPIEKPYSIVFHVDSEGIMEYYPKADKLHRRKDNTWLTPGLNKLKQLFPNNG